MDKLGLSEQHPAIVALNGVIADFEAQMLQLEHRAGELNRQLRAAGPYTRPAPLLGGLAAGAAGPVARPPTELWARVAEVYSRMVSLQERIDDLVLAKKQATAERDPEQPDLWMPMLLTGHDLDRWSTGDVERDRAIALESPLAIQIGKGADGLQVGLAGDQGWAGIPAIELLGAVALLAAASGSFIRVPSDVAPDKLQFLHHSEVLELSDKDEMRATMKFEPFRQALRLAILEATGGSPL